MTKILNWLIGRSETVYVLGAIALAQGIMFLATGDWPWALATVWLVALMFALYVQRELVDSLQDM